MFVVPMYGGTVIFMLRFMLKNRKFWLLLILFTVPLILMVSAPQAITLVGQGATFPEPLIMEWIIHFQERYGNITVIYKGTGSGAGVKAILSRTVDFAGSDAPMKLSEWEEANRKFGPIFHIPETMGGVAVVFNIPEVEELNLSGDVLADIYLGRIEYWDDPRIVSLNPGVGLPHERIYVVKRADSSGTTYIVTDYLSHVSAEWASTIGKTKTFSFPGAIRDRGLTGYGNAGVAQIIQQIPYSIGYVEFAYAVKGELKTVALRNKAGNFVKPSLETIAEAAKYASPLPDPEESWHNVSIVNSPGENTYPIVSFTYILVYKYQDSPEICAALKTWLRWILTEGQQYSERLLYPSLPQNIVEIGLSAVERLQTNISSEGCKFQLCLIFPLFLVSTGIENSSCGERIGEDN